MITQFKIFEDSEEIKKFWLVKISDEIYFLASLYHINCTEDEIKYFTDTADCLRGFGANYIYIDNEKGYNEYNEEGSLTLGYKESDEESFKWYSDRDYIYMGKIKPTKENIKMAELELATKKYNL